jgi:hypothetical protein
MSDKEIGDLIAGSCVLIMGLLYVILNKKAAELANRWFDLTWNKGIARFSATLQVDTDKDDPRVGQIVSIVAGLIFIAIGIGMISVSVRDLVM